VGIVSNPLDNSAGRNRSGFLQMRKSHPRKLLGPQPILQEATYWEVYCEVVVFITANSIQLMWGC